MDKVKQFLAAVAAVCAMASCQQNQAYSAELAQIDSAKVVLSNYQELLDSIESANISALAVHVDTQYGYLIQNYPSQDDREFWLEEVPSFGTINKMFNRYLEHREDVQEQIVYTTKQLDNLQNSIEDEKLAQEEITQYLNSEMEASAILEYKFNRYVRGGKLAIVMWQEDAVRYDSIVNNLRAQQ